MAGKLPRAFVLAFLWLSLCAVLLQAAKTPKTKQKNSKVEEAINLLSQATKPKQIKKGVVLGRKIFAADSSVRHNAKFVVPLAEGILKGGVADEAKQFVTSLLSVKPLPPADLQGKLMGVLARAEKLLGASDEYVERVCLVSLQGDPDNISCLTMLTQTYLMNEGSADLAATHARRLSELQPGMVANEMMLGMALSRSSQYAEAAAVYERALGTQGRYCDAVLALIRAYMAMMAWDRVAEWAQNLVSIFKSGKCMCAVELMSGIKLRSSMDCLETDWVFTMFELLPASMRDSIVKENWRTVEIAGDAIRKQAKGESAIVPISLPAGTHFRIGYSSATGWVVGAVPNLMLGTLSYYNKKTFQVILYTQKTCKETLPKKGEFDAVVALIDGLAEHSTRFHCQKVADELMLARTINADQVHVLLDTAGDSRTSMHGLLSHRPSHTQVVYLELYTGGENKYVDFTVANPVARPPEYQSGFLEPALNYPGQYGYFANAYLDRKSEKTLGLLPPRKGQKSAANAHGIQTLCCFSKTFKISSDDMATWLDIMELVPTTKLKLQADSIPDSVMGMITDRAIDEKRISLFPPGGVDDFLKEHRTCDLVVDSTFFNGGKTVMDALWMGRPVLTMPGNHMYRRAAAHLLTSLDVPELLMQSRDEYVDFAVDLLTNPAKLRRLERKIERNRLPQYSPMYDAQQTIGQLNRMIEGAFELRNLKRRFHLVSS